MMRARACAGLVWILTASLGARPAGAQGLFEEAVDQSASTDAPQSQPASPSAASSASDTAPAAGGGPGALSGARLGGLDLELGGHLRGARYLGKLPGKNATETKAGYGELGLKLTARKGRWGSAFGELRLRAGYEGGAQAAHRFT